MTPHLFSFYRSSATRSFFRLMILFGLAASLGLLGIAPSRAIAAPGDWIADLAPAEAALASRDYLQAYALYQTQADRDNPLAQFSLGLFHHNGWGMNADPAAACAWFEKAARHGIPAAQHYWGDCLAQGIGRPADIPTALTWYDKAASLGHLISWCSVADHYIQGRGVERDVPRGIELCTRVARARSPVAMLQLAHYYREGLHLPQNLALARQWYQEAAAFQVAEAQYWLGLMLAQGLGGPQDSGEALRWLEEAAGAGHAPAYLPTAILYANQPLQEKTGALAPEHLARTYLWTRAARGHSTDPNDLAEIGRIEDLLAQIVPPTWRPTLDRQVDEHLRQFSATREAAHASHSPD
ncbi:sel1 repeat family protein [Pseudothauera nasutitermitis]|uniref:Sel1 repeat family protein n=1 Tax=Pseudothauera nasutitermitis TaxID=2565930 RepID=A0A4S4AUJ6_9RHOO|nr:tetratricopeptide repeat protein [Pseudothauera nasutitermitis]THF63627.1 sel1 repeat family protein [Pseudothauera nasutitermitis]